MLFKIDQNFRKIIFIFRLTPTLAENEFSVDKVKLRRNCIPSKDDPSEEMTKWLKTFTVSTINIYIYNNFS